MQLVEWNELIVCRRGDDQQYRLNTPPMGFGMMSIGNHWCA